MPRSAHARALFRPTGAQQRAEAALAAARAMGESAARKPAGEAKASVPAAAPRSAAPSATMGAPVRARPAPAAAPASLDSVLGPVESAAKGAKATSGGRGMSSGASAGAQASSAPGATPGPDFWGWSPPTEAEGDALASPELKLQRAAAKAVRQAAPVRERAPAATLPPLQSDVEAPAWQEALLSRLSAVAPPEQSVAAAVADAAPVDVAAALAGAAAAMREAAPAAAGAPTSGVLADGSRWWSESGSEEREAGRLCRWTVVRGCSADGATEWQEKWWESSDTWAYRELGAEKSGRDATGRVWREAWTEVYEPDPVTGLGHIRRNADKWARDAAGATWHEEWREAFWADGRTERDAAKWGALAPGVIPEDGHAGVWHEKWGEKWDGKGGASKVRMPCFGLFYIASRSKLRLTLGIGTSVRAVD